MLWFVKRSAKKEITPHTAENLNNPGYQIDILDNMDDMFEKLWNDGTVGLMFTRTWGALLKEPRKAVKDIFEKFGEEGMKRFFDFAVNKKKKELLGEYGILLEPIFEELGDAEAVRFFASRGALNVPGMGCNPFPLPPPFIALEWLQERGIVDLQNTWEDIELKIRSWQEKRKQQLPDNGLKLLRESQSGKSMIQSDPTAGVDKTEIVP